MNPSGVIKSGLTEADVPAMICPTLETLLTDEHVTAGCLLPMEEHPQEGPITTIRRTILLDGAPISPGPRAGPLCKRTLLERRFRETSTRSGFGDYAGPESDVVQ